jgi:hypothetical protein
MKALAEYVMRGRSQALWVAVLAAGTLLFSWVSASVIALVTLRRGLTEGGHILMWAVLPAAVVLYMGEIGPFGMVVGTTILAGILRHTVSWQATLVAASFVGVLTGLALVILSPGYLAQIADIFSQIFADFEKRLEEGGSEVQILAPGPTQIAGILGLMNAFSCVMCLLLARWWQSMLYNPGGFGTEFRALRLSPQVSTILIGGGLVIASFGIEYRIWAVLAALPLSIAGIALVHHKVHQRVRGSQPLVFFYMLWLFFDLTKAAVVALALIDSYKNLRGDQVADNDSDNGSGDAS